jgi:hypothetical protein
MDKEINESRRSRGQIRTKPANFRVLSGLPVIRPEHGSLASFAKTLAESLGDIASASCMTGF